MKKFIIWLLLLIVGALIFFYLGYMPAPEDIDVTTNILGYNIQTSRYTILALVCVFLLITSVILKIVSLTQYFFHGIFSFFGTRSKEKSQEALLNAYAYALANKPTTAKNFLKKSEPFFKGSEHYAVLRLVTEQMQGTERPSTEFLARIEASKMLRPVGNYIEARYQVYDKDIVRKIELLQNSGSYIESKEVLWEFLSVLIRNKKFSQAETIIRGAKALLADEEFKRHLVAMLTVLSQESYHEKNPEQSLSYGLEALKYRFNPIALFYVVNSYKVLLRENKVIRMINDHFAQMPTMSLVRLFLDLKTAENPEETGKRIATLPRNHENNEAFIALQAYYFCMVKDFTSLASSMKIAQSFSDRAWYRCAKLCLQLEKESFVFAHAFNMFEEAIACHSRQEIDAFYDNMSGGQLYAMSLKESQFYPKMTEELMMEKINLFEDMIKFIPLLSSKTTTKPTDKLDNMDIYQIEGNIHNLKR